MNKVITTFTKNKEVKNAGWIIAGKVSQLLLSLAVSIFTARYLGPGNYGLINYASAFVIFFTSFCTLGINSVIIKNFVDYPKEQGTAIGSAIIARMISSFLSVLLIFGIVSFTDRGDAESISVVLLCSFSLLFQPFDIIVYWFQNRYESKVTALVSFLAYVLTTLYKIMLLVLNKGIKWFALATCMDYFAIAILLIIAYKMHGGPNLHFSFDKCKQLLSKSQHYILSGMMIAIYGQTDKFMLKHMLDEASVGYYSLATTINNMWVFVLAAIIDSVYPTILRLYADRNMEAYNRKNRQLYAIVIYVSAAVALLFTLFGKPLIGVFYGNAYIPSYQPLKYIVWYTVFSYLGVARNAWIVCENKQKYLKYLYLAAAVVNILLNYLFIPVWGATGAAFASFVTQFLTAIVLPFLIKPLRSNVKLMADAFLLRKIR